MRPSTGYKIVGGFIIASALVAIVSALFGTPTAGPGTLAVLIGFLLYRRGMRLAAQESPQLRSVHVAVVSAWFQGLARRLRGRT